MRVERVYRLQGRGDDHHQYLNRALYFNTSHATVKFHDMYKPPEQIPTVFYVLTLLKAAKKDMLDRNAMFEVHAQQRDIVDCTFGFEQNWLHVTGNRTFDKASKELEAETTHELLATKFCRCLFLPLSTWLNFETNFENQR